MSIIDLIVQTIVAGATLSRTPECSLPLQRAYRALISYLQSHYPHIDLDRITKQPDSVRGRIFLAEDLANAQADQDKLLLLQVHGLIDALHTHQAAIANTVGVDLAALTTAALRIRDVQSSGTGVRMTESTVHGTTEIDGVTGGITGQGTAVAIGGSIFYGDVYIGADADKVRQIKALREAYLRRLLTQLDTLALSGIDPKTATQEQASGLRMSAVYTALLTQTTEHGMGGDAQLAQLRKGEPRRLSALEQLNRHNRLVLLGDPGSGKSTFVNFVALCMGGELLRDPAVNLTLLTQPLPPEKEARAAQAKEEKTPEPQPWQHGPLLPVRVVLRDFAASGLLGQGGAVGAAQLWTFINNELTKAGQGEFAEGLKQELLGRGGLILLDGLDEVPEADARRAQLKGVIEDFAAGLGKCRILLTSRTYAYQNQAWQLRGFTAPILAPFSDGQIRHFVERWYAHRAAVLLQDPTAAQGRAELLKAAIFRSARLHDLVERPLLLTLTASLHAWRGGSLPERREELYADAVDLLLDAWEGQRVVRDGKGASVAMQPSLAEYLQVGRDKVLALLQRLAYNAHSRQPELVGTADLAEDELVLALLGLTERSDLQPRLLVDYLSQRAGLLIPRGVKVYTFPHRTFQEYLAACHLTGEGFPEELARLACHDPNRWREALLLAAAKVARGTPFALWSLVDELCPHLLTTSRCATGQAWGTLLAGQAIAELVRDPVAGLPELSPRHQERVDRVRHSLVHILTGTVLPANERALAGRTLAYLGDPRPEVMTVAGMQFCYIPPGPFFRTDQKHTKTELSYGYWMARYPVTNAQFQAFVAAGGYEEKRFWTEAQQAGYWTKAGFKSRIYDEARTGPYDLSDPYNLTNHPVIGISWYEALAFCRWLAAQLPSTGGFADRWTVRLPSEAEWEKAAVGGTTIPTTPTVAMLPQLTSASAGTMQRNPLPKRDYPWGDGADSELANCIESKIETTSAVGAFQAGSSPYEVEELSGSVWEWSNDDYDETYILRGNSFNSEKSKVAVSSLVGDHPDYGALHLYGFRCLVVPISHP